MELVLILLINIVVILIFRRLDKANLKINKVKRYAEKSANELEKLVQNKKQTIHDATIDLEILLKRTTSVMNDLEKKWNSAQIKQNEFMENEDGLKKIEEQVKLLNQLAIKTNENIEYLRGNLKLLYATQKEIDGLSQQVLSLINI